MLSGKNLRLLRFARNDRGFNAILEGRGWLAAKPPTNPSPPPNKQIMLSLRAKRSNLFCVFIFLPDNNE